MHRQPSARSSTAQPSTRRSRTKAGQALDNHKAAQPTTEVEQPQQPQQSNTTWGQVRGCEHVELSFARAMYTRDLEGSGYRIGLPNPIYEQRSLRIRSTKSVVPKTLPPVKFRSGLITDYLEYTEMLEYYQARQLELLTKRDSRGLQQLEIQFCRTYMTPPKLEDYNSTEEFKVEYERWIQNERMRVIDGFSPYCLPEAKRLMGTININPAWASRHTSMVDEYEQYIRDNHSQNPRNMRWECNNPRFSLG